MNGASTSGRKASGSRVTAMPPTTRMLTRSTRVVIGRETARPGRFMGFLSSGSYRLRGRARGHLVLGDLRPPRLAAAVEQRVDDRDHDQGEHRADGETA